MKRFIALFMCFVLLFSLVGCGQKEPIDDNSTTTTTEEDVFWDDNSDTTTTTQASKESTTKKETTTKQETTTKKIDTSMKSIKTKEYKTSSATQTVYYPDNIQYATKPYPVIAWANGTAIGGSGIEFVDNYYDKLLVEIAKGGYIVVACDESMSADGKAQIASIDFILSKNNDKNDIFYNKINTNKIGVIGHSQGGRSSVNAANADSRIDCVISIAGSNFDYEVEGLKAPTFFIAGTKDWVVSPSQWIEPAYEIAEGPTVYASLKNADHFVCNTEPQKYFPYILDWLDGWLKNDSNALNTFKDGGKLSKDSAWVDFKCKNL